jgi:hypothetical protein
MQIFNVRLGFATNSSSAHSVIIVEGPGALQEMPPDGSHGWENFTLTSETRKKRYLAAQIYCSLIHTLPRSLATVIATHWAGLPIVELTDDMFAYDSEAPWLEVDHESVWDIPHGYNTDKPDREFVRDLQAFLLRKDVVVLGGNDNDDAHPDAEAGDKVRMPFSTDLNESAVCRKDKKYGYWSIFNKHNGTKIRFCFQHGPKKMAPAKAYAPELVDLKITDRCNCGCNFCYQESTPDGKHADMKMLSRAINAMAQHKVFEVAIGGGDPTTHPHFHELLEKCAKNGITPNFSTRDHEWLDNPVNRDVFQKCGGAIAISAGDPFTVRRVGAQKLLYRLDRGRAAIHYVMGTRSLSTLEDMLRACHEVHLPIVLLGYKKIGTKAAKFAAGWGMNKIDGWEDILIKLREEGKCPRVSVDTALLEAQPQAFQKMGIPDILMMPQEGTFSMYVDAVEGKAGPSSYDSESLVDYEMEQDWKGEKLVELFASF